MLKPIEPVTYRPLNLAYPLTIQFDGRLFKTLANDEVVLQAALEHIGEVGKLHIAGSTLEALPYLSEHVFIHFPEIKRIDIDGVETESLRKSSTLAKFITQDGLQISREEFFQLPDPWVRRRTSSIGKEEWTETNGIKHPVRPKVEPGVFYRRYVPSIRKTISFRTVNIDRDLEKFHYWHNQPRVYDLWELNKPIEELRVYLENGQKDPHQYPVILEYDDEPAGYFELYWAAEDRLGPYYDHAPYDRGFHFLIGEEKFLGRANTDAAIRSVMHFLYLDDSRTMRIMAEPRADNQRVLKYVQLVPGWRFIKEFDFPHKRAALLSARREDFFRNGEAL